MDRLLGLVFTSIVCDADEDSIKFFQGDKLRFELKHEQDCCENVYIESIVGDLESLIGQEILLAECVSEESERTEWGTSTWTFYKLASIKGYIDIRFLGESNGYYSESVSCQKVELPINENVVLETKYFKVLENGGDK